MELLNLIGLSFLDIGHYLEFMGFLFDLVKQKYNFYSVFFDIFSFLLLPVILFFYFYVTYKVFYFLSQKIKLKKINLDSNAKHIAWLYSTIPLGGVFFPLILAFSNRTLKGLKKHIIIGIFIGLFFTVYHGSVFTESISLLYFLPIILLIFLIYNPKRLFLKILKYLGIIIIIFILLTQPFYRQLFYDRTDPENQKICYSRPLDDINKGPCFKIFKGIKIDSN